MSTEVRSRAEGLFYEALELASAQRETFLNQACNGDLSLRAEVDELLEAHEGAAKFLQVDAPASPELEVEFARLKPEEAGERIGHYKLLEQIGEGGFGVVWVAEQEKPVRRRVALKIIKLGMDTRDVIARFEQERQALAMMDHPNIAKVLDAGATPFGRPYFAMELVRGIKITEYCDQANLRTEERLQLFIAVCTAVQHAHQKGIIHRDLKPSNILVTLHDGVPVPKVIDFGVAKATQQQRLTDLTVYTQFEQMIGTPLYMSPEQAEMSGLDIDTRSDIYSLGVLLYELLVGRTPFDPQKLMKAGFDEMRRVIREEEPQKPSTFLSTMALELRTNSARHRQTDSAKWMGQIRGDLDWIVMKSLEKDRRRRYETANGLAKDIERHLASEPVLARPPTTLYRFRRFAKRNKVAFTAASAVLAALLVGLGISTWLFFKERQTRQRAVVAEERQVRLRQLAELEEKRATNAARKSEQVARFLTDMLGGVAPSKALGRDTAMLREILDKTAKRLGKDLNNQPDVEADLRDIIGRVYADLGAYEKSEAMFRRTLALRRKLLGDEHPAVAETLCSLAQILEAGGELETAEVMHREALAMRRKVLGDEHMRVAYSLMCLAGVLRGEGKLAEAEAVAREAVAMCRKLRGNDHEMLAGSLQVLGQALGWQGKPESESVGREAMAIRKKLFGNEHPLVADSLLNMAQGLRGGKKFAESEAVNREALAIFRKIFGQEHPAVAYALENLGGVLGEMERFPEAEAAYREALAVQEKLVGNEHQDVAKLLHKLAPVLQRQGKLEEAETTYRKTVEIFRKRFGNENLSVATVLNELGVALANQGRLTEAEATFQETLTLSRKLERSDPKNVAICATSLANVLQHQKKWAEAEPRWREAVAISRGSGTKDLPTSRLRLDGLAQSLYRQKKYAEAETALREALTLSRELHGNDHEEVATGLQNLGAVLEAEGKLAEAEAMYREAVELQKKLSGNYHPKVASSIVLLSTVLRKEGKLEEATALLLNELEPLRSPATKDSESFGAILSGLAECYYRQGDYARAEPLYRDLVATHQRRFAADHENPLQARASLARLLTDWGWKNRFSSSENRPAKLEAAARAREAERLLRDCLSLRLRGSNPTTNWRTHETRSRLGGALLAVAVTKTSKQVRLAELREAESLLLEGNEALQKSEDVQPIYKRDAVIRLIRLYEAWGKAEKLKEWEYALSEFDKTGLETDKKEKTVPSEP